MQSVAIEQQMQEHNQTILTPLVSLDSPRKATVEVVIVADPVSDRLTFTITCVYALTLLHQFQELLQLQPH